MSSDNRRTMVYMVLSSAVALTIAFRVGTVRAEQTRPFGKMTAPEVIDKGEVLSREIATMTNSLRFSASRQTTYSTEGKRKRLWTVFGTDWQGKYLLGLAWNADTGELVHVSNNAPSIKEPGRPTLPKQEAIRVTREWLRVLGMAAAAPRWWLCAEPEHDDCGVYGVRWRAPDREVAVFVDDQTGELITMDRLRPRSLAAPTVRPRSKPQGGVRPSRD